MSKLARTKLTVLAVAAATAIGMSDAEAQGSTYSLVEGWAELPRGVEGWGQTIGVEMDTDGSLWVFHRCFAGVCTNRDDVAPVLRYDPSGRLVESWGQGRYVWPHGFALDDEGFLWTTDARGTDGKGHTVMKLSRDGDVLMTIGTPGVAGAGEDTFDGPADVAIAPNGDIFVADGHGNDRIVKFSPEGEFIMEWGTEGTDYGQFNEPHTLAFDSRGRLFVGDRINQRIQVFDQNGRFLAVWPAIMASGMHITPDDIVYVADYQLRQGIVIARASDFQEIGFVDNALGEGVAVDDARNVYVGEVIYNNLKKFIRSPAP
jgi:DNA-binding beta-propeller fold protein YncE